MDVERIIDEFKDWCKGIGGKLEKSWKTYYCVLEDDVCDVIEGIHIFAKKRDVNGHIELSAIGTKQPWELGEKYPRKPDFAVDFEGQIVIDGYGKLFGDVNGEMHDLGSEMSFKAKCPCAISVSVDTTRFPRPTVRITAYTKDKNLKLG